MSSKGQQCTRWTEIPGFYEDFDYAASVAIELCKHLMDSESQGEAFITIMNRTIKDFCDTCTGLETEWLTEANREDLRVMYHEELHSLFPNWQYAPPVSAVRTLPPAGSSGPVYPESTDEDSQVASPKSDTPDPASQSDVTSEDDMEQVV